MELSNLSTPTSLALLAAGIWGFWAFFTKLATRSTEPETVLLISYVTASVVGAAAVYLSASTTVPEPTGVAFSVAGGAAAGLGSVFYYTGLQRGNVGAVSTIVALYFVVATILGIVVLHEGLTVKKAAGIVFAVAAVALLAN